MFSQKSSNTSKVLQILVSAVALFVFGAEASSAEPTSDKKSILYIATREDIPPYVQNDASSGLEIDLIRAVFANTGYDVNFIQLPRIRMIQMFEEGSVNGVSTQNIQVSPNFGCATETYLTHRNVGATLASSAIHLRSLDDLEGLAVLSFSGATRYLGSEFASATKKSRRYTESEHQQTHIELLYKKRFDVAIGEEWILRLIQRKYFDTTREYWPLKIHYIMPTTHYVARFHDPAVCDAFNKSYHDLEKREKIAGLIKKYRTQIMIESHSSAMSTNHLQADQLSTR